LNYPKSNIPGVGALAGIFVGFCATICVGLAAAQTFPNTVTTRNFFRSGSDSLTFERPVLVKPYPGEDSAFIVLQQGGKILTVRWVSGMWRRTDSASVGVLNGTNGIDEQGLLGFAFHPGFPQNRKYYIYYVGGSVSARFDILAERIAGASLRPATSDAHRTIFRVSDPYDNHNAGTLGFDSEGALVFAIGDGGTTSGDPQNRAQNPDSLLGKFLRINVDGADAYPSDTARNYAIPSTNPFKDSAGYRPEIWALGVRNPWKWSFHPVTGEIWAGDVGQNRYEEIDRVPKGANLGWRQREGLSCFNPATNCLSAGFQDPALTMQRSHATSITGGVFFMGNASSAFNGAYIFGDYGTHHVWAARVQNGKLVDSTRIGSVNKVVSFDRDLQGRILATSISLSPDFAISSNVGKVFVLESPDMNLPVAIRPMNPAAHGPRAMDFLRNPEDYEIRGLNGQRLRGKPTGAFLAVKKGAKGIHSAPILMALP
jgi:glucose/arabinose dehydrogenase